MWIANFALSLGAIVVAFVIALFLRHRKTAAKGKVNLFNALFAGVFFSVVFIFYPVNRYNADATVFNAWRAFLLSVFHSIQVFTAGCEFALITDCIEACPQQLSALYQFWAAALFVIAPILTFSFVLSLFKNLTAYIKYLGAFFKDTYIFSKLTDQSLTLAEDIKRKNKNAFIIFTDVFEDSDEMTESLADEATKIGAICFKKDLLAIDFKKHSKKKALHFFTLGSDETENLNQALQIIELYKDRKNTHLYAFSTKIDSALLLTAVDKGCIKVRRINEVQSLVNRLLYERGEILFESATPDSDGIKRICAVVVGLGRHGLELVKALTWYGQMDGYRIEIHAFDKDPLAEEKFTNMAPELMSEEYNGVYVDGEAQYKITIHSGVDVNSISFVDKIKQLTRATYVVVALGEDDANIHTAFNLRMHFERIKIHPIIQAIVYNTQQKRALEGICNYRGQPYDIELLGDTATSYTEDVILDCELENDALRSHLKWGKEEEFWTYEYNYRSSMASAIHRRARLCCGIAGSGKKEEELTVEERDVIEKLEHRRWNAYMRAEGYIFSGSTDKASRNDLAKMHHDLVDFASLDEETKRKDSSVGTG